MTDRGGVPEASVADPAARGPGMTGRSAPPAEAVADAPPGNWVDAWAPVRTRPYLRLSRADRPIGTWLLLLPCLWGLALAAGVDGARMGDAWIAAGCAVGAVLMRGAGCTWNDISDRHFDAAVARTRSRPIPSGQVTVRQATGWMVMQAALAGAILLTFDLLAILLGIGSLALVAVYPFAKRFTWWPQVFLGLAFNWGVLLAWAAHAGRLSLAPVVLWIGGIGWTLFYDTIYAHQDKEDDALIGVKSTARLFGNEGTRIWMRRFIAVAVGFALLAVWLAWWPGASTPRVVVGIAAVCAFGLHLVRQLSRLDPADPAGCLAVFRSNRDAGLILAVGLGIAALV